LIVPVPAAKVVTLSPEGTELVPLLAFHVPLPPTDQKLSFAVPPLKVPLTVTAPATVIPKLFVASVSVVPEFTVSAPAKFKAEVVTVTVGVEPVIIARFPI
jgi:hypothetical protein